MKILRLIALCLVLASLAACVCVPVDDYDYRQVAPSVHYEYRGRYGHPHGNPYHSYRYYRHSGGQGYPYYPR